MLKKNKVIMTLLITVMCIVAVGCPVFAESTTGGMVAGIWDTVYGVIKEVGGTLSIATFVCSGFYFFIIGKSQRSLDLARGLMIGAAAGIIIIYIGPTIMKAVINLASSKA